MAVWFVDDQGQLSLFMSDGASRTKDNVATCDDLERTGSLDDYQETDVLGAILLQEQIARR